MGNNTKKSTLNPEAPVFYPVASLGEKLKKGYTSMQSASKVTNHLPSGAAVSMYQTHQAYRQVIAHISDCILQQTNQILVHQQMAFRLKLADDHETNMERTVTANDSNVDSVCAALDVAEGRAPAPAAWNRAPTLATVHAQARQVSLVSAQNITRPQLVFSDAVDNSLAPFRPRLTYKPNALKPLQIVPVFGDRGELLGYEHPYKAELNVWEPPQWAVQGGEGAPPPPLAATPLTMVDTRDALEQLVRHLDTVQEIAVDLEHHSYRSYQGFTCLIQLSTDTGGDFIVDALALRDHLHLLNYAFTNPNKIKIFHGAMSDVRWLQRDFGVYIVGLFDTHVAATILALPAHSLKFLLQLYCGVDVDKTFQLADWRIRPLPEQLVSYARADTHYLLYVWRHMRSLLRSRGQLRLAFKRSQQVAGVIYEKPHPLPDERFNQYRQRLSGPQMNVLHAAWSWRDSAARKLDESPAYLLPEHQLLTAVQHMPRDLQGLRALVDTPSPFFKERAHELHQIILACRTALLPPTVLSMPPAVRMMAAPGPACQPPHDMHFIPPHPYEPQVAREGTLAEADLAAFADTALAKEPVPNAEASLFVPPYERYLAYRVLHQTLELKKLEDKEARVAALGRDSEVICEEVLRPLQAVRASLAADALLKPSTSQSTDDSFQPKDGSSQPKDASSQPKDTSPQSKDTSPQSKDTSPQSKASSSASNVGESSNEAQRPHIYQKANYNKLRTPRSEQRRRPPRN